jgi:hypothetical protein
VTRRLATKVSALVFVAAVGVSCSSSGGDRATGAGDGPGTPLLSGFTVPRGSHRVGPVFVTPTAGGETRLAVLDITKDPLRVYDRFAAQGRRLGIALPGTGVFAGSDPLREGTCLLSLGDRGAAFQGTLDPKVVREISCRSGSVLPSGETIAVSTRWGGRLHHALVETDPRLAGSRQPQATPSARRARTPRRLPVVHDRSDVSEPGTPIGTANDAFDAGYRRFRLERGSRVVADLGDLLVLEVTGNARRVLAGYARQLGAGGEVPLVTTVVTAKGPVLAVSDEPYGGGSTLLITDPSRRWILVRSNSD